MKRTQILTFLLLLTFVLLFSSEIAAQCPMCKMGAEANLKDGGSAGKGLNTGILYMFFSPYLLVGIIGYWWYKNQKNEQQ